jgi:hypothetical protein
VVALHHKRKGRRREEGRRGKKGPRSRRHHSNSPEKEKTPDFLLSTTGLDCTTTVLHYFNSPPYQHPATTSPR